MYVASGSLESILDLIPRGFPFSIDVFAEGSPTPPIATSGHVGDKEREMDPARGEINPRRVWPFLGGVFPSSPPPPPQVRLSSTIEPRITTDT